MNRKGFTLMELLLVVAVLAIVAAAAAPTFFGGAKEAMEEAKKASFMSAYQNTISGANLIMGISASKGKVPTTGAILKTDDYNLDHYAPLAARTFTTINGDSYVFTAVFNGTEVEVSCNKGNTEPTAAGTNKVDVTTNKTVDAALTALWEAINKAS